MIVISGKRASGKSEAGRILERNHGFTYFDTGPAMREGVADYNRRYNTSLDTAGYIQRMIEDSGDPAWAIKFDVNHLAALSRRAEIGRIVLVGYRNYPELESCTTMLETEIGQKVDRKILYVEAAFDIALARFMARDNIDDRQVATALLTEKHSIEEAFGVSEMRDNADIIIENNSLSLQELELSVAGALHAIGRA